MQLPLHMRMSNKQQLRHVFEAQLVWNGSQQLPPQVSQNYHQYCILWWRTEPEVTSRSTDPFATNEAARESGSVWGFQLLIHV